MGYRPCTKDKYSLPIATGQRQKKTFYTTSHHFPGAETTGIA